MTTIPLDTKEINKQIEFLLGERKRLSGLLSTESGWEKVDTEERLISITDELWDLYWDQFEDNVKNC